MRELTRPGRVRGLVLAGTWQAHHLGRSQEATFCCADAREPLISITSVHRPASHTHRGMVHSAEVAVLVEAYLMRSGYTAAAASFQRDAGRQLASVAPYAGQVKDLEVIINGYVQTQRLMQPIREVMSVLDRRPAGAAVLGVAAVVFSLRVFQLRRRKRLSEKQRQQAEAVTRSAKVALVSEQTDGTSQAVEAEPSWLGEAAALVGLSFETKEDSGNDACGRTGDRPVAG